MNTIAFEDGGAQEETVSAFLVLVLEDATEVDIDQCCVVATPREDPSNKGKDLRPWHLAECPYRCLG